MPIANWRRVLAEDWATIVTLWWRDVLRFLRQPSRLVGALGQPVIFWFVIGSGFAGTFTLAREGVGYEAYFFPGVVTMVALFSSIFASVSVIDDRHQGFLLPVLAGPGGRAALVVGKTLGSASVALLQIALFLSLAPMAGFAFGDIDWLPLVAALVATCVGLSALGFAMAWLLDNVQAYHALQMIVLVPAWVVSGAMFPATDASGHLAAAMRANPLAYAVAAVRHALYGGLAPSGTTVCDAGFAQLFCWGFAAGALLLAVGAAHGRRHV